MVFHETEQWKTMSNTRPDEQVEMAVSGIIRHKT